MMKLVAGRECLRQATLGWDLMCILEICRSNVGGIGKFNLMDEEGGGRWRLYVSATRRSFGGNC